MQLSSLKYVVAALVMLSLAGCSSSDEQKTKRIIVTTTGMIADAVRNIFPNDSVISLMGAGVDPHVYKATQGDLAKVRSAAFVVYNGHKLEGKLDQILFNLRSQKPCIALAELLPNDSLVKLNSDGKVYDPHIWFDVLLWKQALSKLADTLSVIYPSESSELTKNTKIYTSQLDSLHTFVQKEISSIPPEQRVLVTAHDAFAYFGRRYGIEVRALQGISTAAEFGIKDISNLADFLYSRKIKAVFVESSVSSRPLESVLRAVQAKGQTIELGGTLFSDALGAEGTPEATYKGMVIANVSTISSALR